MSPSQRAAHLDAPSRLAGVDLARGLAVIGMFAAHLLDTADGWVWTDPSTWSSIVDGRSSILFATLAGVSIGLVSGGTAPVDGERLAVVRRRLGVRAGMLWLIGILLILTEVPVYVILPAYGILFVLALPFLRLRAPTLLGAAAVLALAMAWLQPALDALPLWSAPNGLELSAALGWHYPFTVWIAFVVAGIGLARSDLRSATVQAAMLLSGAGLAVIGYGLDGSPPSDPYLQIVWQAAPHSSGLLEVVGSGGFAIAVLGACLLLCRARGLRMLTLPLRATGAMPLTAYAGQLLVWALVALVTIGDPGDLFAFRALDPFWPLVLGTAAFATAWALLLGRGPLERVMDRTAKLVVPDRLVR